MITDGKPSCLKLPDGTYYKNSVGLDETIVEKCYTMARQAVHIPITTFMIAKTFTYSSLCALSQKQIAEKPFLPA